MIYYKNGLSGSRSLFLVSAERCSFGEATLVTISSASGVVFSVKGVDCV